MSAAEWATLVAAIGSVAVIFVSGIRFIVKHYLHELVPNSGSSMKDAICRLEERVDKIFELLSQQK